MFEFYDPGVLVDDDLELVLVENYPGNPAINYVPAYKFNMRQVGTSNVVGTFELRIGNTGHIIKYGGHIAYFVSPLHRGQRFAARALILLIPLARKHEMKRLWITCNPENTASRRTCQIVGAKLIDVVELPEDTDMYREGERRKCRYRLDL